MTAAVPRVTCINIQRQKNEAQINSLLFMSKDTVSQKPPVAVGAYSKEKSPSKLNMEVLYKNC